MGNAESNVTSGVKKQAGTCAQSMYRLVDLKGKQQSFLMLFLYEFRWYKSLEFGGDLKGKYQNFLILFLSAFRR
jgi:hypothetical protein